MEKVANTYRSKVAAVTLPKPNQAQAPKIHQRLGELVSDRRTHLTFGIALVFFSFYLLVACVSHVFTGRADQSLLYVEPGVSTREAAREIENWTGYFGAWLSDVLMFKGFGLGALFIPPLLFGLGYRIIFNRTLLGQKKPFARFVAFSVLAISMILGLVVLQAGLEARWGWLSGAVGYEFSAVLYEMMGIGAWLVIALAVLGFGVFFFNATSFGQVKKQVKAEIDTIQNRSRIEQEMAASMVDVRAETHVETKPLNGKSSIENELSLDVFITETDEETTVTTEDGITFELHMNEQGITGKPTHTKPLQNGPSFEVVTPTAEEPTVSESPHSLSNSILDEPLEIHRVEDEPTVAKNLGSYDPTLDLSTYRFPVLELLEDHGQGSIMVDNAELESNKDTIVGTLLQYGINIASIKATVGPTVTLYEIVPEAGVRISKIKNLEDDIALSLAALGIRIIAPMPGKGTIGIEVPNKKREVVSCRSVLSTEKFMRSDMALPIALGKTISNEVFITDLAKMPHLLMAGATGQGKSVGLNVILTSLIYKKHPSQLKFVLVDPKKVELSVFSTIERHFLAKLPNAEEAIITDTRKVVNTLNSLCELMDQRYDLLKEAGCRNIKEYNQKFVARQLNPEKGHQYLPYIVLVIDELADLMMTAGKEVETPIARLAQLARAIGIHLVVATQRPSVNVITGLIKANFPARLSFKVTSKIDSRTILDQGGADRLIGYGDMLLSIGSDLIRLQCPFIDTPEVERLCSFVGEQRGYPTAYLLPEYVGEGDDDSTDDFDPVNRDAMFDDAARIIVQFQQGSASLLQRKLKLGYARAGRIIDQLEAAGIVGAFDGGKPREVLVKDSARLEEMLTKLDQGLLG